MTTTQRITRATLTTIAATLAFAAPASAELTAPPENAERWLKRAQAIALNFWNERGQWYCRGVEVEIRWHAQGTLGGHMATAPLDACYGSERTFINVSEYLATRPFRKRCGTIVHEYGHLNGLRHEARMKVMNSSWSPPECAKPAQAQRRWERMRRVARTARRAWRRNRARALAKRYHAALRTNEVIFGIRDR